MRISSRKRAVKIPSTGRAPVRYLLLEVVGCCDPHREATVTYRSSDDPVAIVGAFARVKPGDHPIAIGGPPLTGQLPRLQ
jgi:hypothetical protein